MVKKWHYLAVKSLWVLFKGITSKHVGDFYCLNCFHSYSIEKKHDHDYCYVEMPNDNNKILRYNNGGKSMKAPCIIYADLIPKNHQQTK